MTDKKPHLVKLKGLTDSDLSKGIGGQLASEMCNHKGRHYMVVAELRVDQLTEKLDDQVIAELVLTQFWPVPFHGAADEHLRGMTAALHREQGFNAAAANGDQQLPLGDHGSEPTVDAVVAAGGRFRPHPYIASTLSTDDDAICDVCGLLADAAPHRAHELGDEPDEPGEGDEQPEVLEDHPDDEGDEGDEGDDVDDPDTADQDGQDGEPLTEPDHDPTDHPIEEPAGQPVLTAVPGDAPARPTPSVNPFAPTPGDPGPGGDVA